MIRQHGIWTFVGGKNKGSSKGKINASVVAPLRGKAMEYQNS
jgi:hypothetical protein